MNGHSIAYLQCCSQVSARLRIPFGLSRLYLCCGHAVRTEHGAENYRPCLDFERNQTKASPFSSQVVGDNLYSYGDDTLRAKSVPIPLLHQRLIHRA